MISRSVATKRSRHKARLTDAVVDRDRRLFLRLAVAQGVAAPVALAAFDGDAADNASPTTSALGRAPRKGAIKYATDQSEARYADGTIIRDFADPYLELLRLLREAAEIEHALMLQYLYCAFSLREPYQDLAGHGSATADNMIGIAIQEMQHLGAVNRLLVALGGSPHLDRQDFPYEPDIYPFAYELEPLSKVALAKYVYAEAPANAFDQTLAGSPDESAFQVSVLSLLDGSIRTNHVGSLYRSILDVLDEVAASADAPISSDDAARWRAELSRIMLEGEDDHFTFFRTVFEADHKAFRGDRSAWKRDSSDPLYPANPVGVNPTAYIGHPNQIAEPGSLLLGWLGDLHYWAVLSTLDYAYRADDDEAIDLAVAQMASAIWPLARALPLRGTGLPFDPLSMGYALGKGPLQSKRIIASLGKETLNFAQHIEHHMPDDYEHWSTGELVRFMEA